MTRKTAIRSTLLLVSLCGTLWAIPTAIEALDEAPTELGAARLPGAATGTRGIDHADPQTVAQWLEQRGTDEAELRILGAADPDLTEAERLALLDEARANAPKPEPKPQ